MPLAASAPPVGRLRAEALVHVLAAAQHHVGAVLVEDLPERLHAAHVAVDLAGAEARLVELGERALRSSFCSRSFSSHSSCGGVAGPELDVAAGVERHHVPGAEVVAVEAGRAAGRRRRRSSRSSRRRRARRSRGRPGSAACAPCAGPSCCCNRRTCSPCRSRRRCRPASARCPGSRRAGWRWPRRRFRRSRRCRPPRRSWRVSPLGACTVNVTGALLPTSPAAVACSACAV